MNDAARNEYSIPDQINDQTAELLTARDIFPEKLVDQVQKLLAVEETNIDAMEKLLTEFEEVSDAD